MRSVPIAAVLAFAACAPEASIRNAVPAVIRVETEIGAGSGVVIACEPHFLWGYRVMVLTAGHVVDGSEGVDLVARHPILDVAIVEIHSNIEVPVVELRQDELLLGEDLWKIGYGHGEFWISRGCASARDRATTPVHPGDSGGAVVVKQGRLVGIVSMMGMQISLRSQVEVPANSLCMFVPILDLQEWLSLYLR